MKHVLLYENYTDFYTGDYVEITKSGWNSPENLNKTAAQILYTIKSLSDQIEKIRGNLDYDEFYKRAYLDEKYTKLSKILDELSLYDIKNGDPIFVKTVDNEEFWIDKIFIIRKLTIEEFKNYKLSKDITIYNL